MVLVRIFPQLVRESMVLGRVLRSDDEMALRRRVLDRLWLSLLGLTQLDRILGNLRREVIMVVLLGMLQRMDL